MQDLQASKFALMLAPISVAGGATATILPLDTKGFRAVQLIITSGLIGANGVPTIVWTESHESNAGNAVNITGTTHTGLVNANDGVIIGCHINLKGNRRRYLSATITVGSTDACLLSAMAILYRAEESPNTATERGLLEQLFV